MSSTLGGQIQGGTDLSPPGKKKVGKLKEKGETVHFLK